MIPDDHPGHSLYMTLKDIERILTNDYGKDHDNPLTAQEIEQVMATLKAGDAVFLPEADLVFRPEGGLGLYCAYVREPKEED